MGEASALRELARKYSLKGRAMPSSISLRLVLSGLLSLGLACGREPELEPSWEGATVWRFTFEEGIEDWEGAVVDYSVDQEEQIGFTFERRALPRELGKGQALFVSGNNPSSSVFMYFTRPVSGLLPGTAYDVGFEVSFGSEAGSGCFGPGGAPGESVYLKVGAVNVAPARVMDERSNYLLNLDKGDQSRSGSQMQVIGNVANGDKRCRGETYRRVSRDNLRQPLRVTSDGEGRLWLVLGTESGVMGFSSFYYDTIRVLLKPV
jgi:hypothetical protein